MVPYKPTKAKTINRKFPVIKDTKTKTSGPKTLYFFLLPKDFKNFVLQNTLFQCFVTSALINLIATRGNQKKRIAIKVKKKPINVENDLVIKPLFILTGFKSSALSSNSEI